jgi:hypothetical protein
MVAPTVEERHGFVEDVAGRDQRRQRIEQGLPVLFGYRVVLVMGQFLGQQVAGVDE